MIRAISGDDDNRSSMKMVFFTTYVKIIGPDQEWTEKHKGSPALVKDGTIRLPIGINVQVGDYLEYQLANDEIRRMIVIDVIPPCTPGTNEADSHIEVTCIPAERLTIAQPVLHPTMSVAVKLVEDGQISEAVTEAFRLVEERIRSLTACENSGRALMESVFGARPPKLDITTTTDQAAEEELEGFRLLFIGAMLGLGKRHSPGIASPGALDETFEYLAVASMLMRRLDRAESRLS